MKKTAGMIALLVVGSLGANSVMASDWNNYRVTITNATTHHVITPPLIVIHNRHFKLFEVATAASEGLATQAETGNPAVLAGEINGGRGVYKIITGDAVIVYGNKASFDFRAPKNAKISMTGMLATSNDAFTAISAKALPKKSVSYMSTTYDAGSEDNNELIVKVAVSSVSEKNALENLSKEAIDFESVKNEATETWNQNLSKIEVATSRISCNK